MTSVLTAFRDNEEKVAAAVAECRRLGIEVRPPDVHRSFVEFTVEDDAIRFGLLAVKNVGEGAIESIISAREARRRFPLTDGLLHPDRPAAREPQVLESLTKVGALATFGSPAQILLGLDDAMTAAQAVQRDRISGQTSLFDLGAAEASALEAPLPMAPDTPIRERLRWEKELLGLYLSEHPMGEVAEQFGQFVTAYSSDLHDESLDGQRVVIGAIVTGIRTVVTKARARWPSSRWRTSRARRGRRLPADVGGDGRDVGRGRHPPGRRADRPSRARRSASSPTSSWNGKPRWPPGRRRSPDRCRLGIAAAAPVAGRRTAHRSPRTEAAAGGRSDRGRESACRLTCLAPRRRSSPLHPPRRSGHHPSSPALPAPIERHPPSPSSRHRPVARSLPMNLRRPWRRRGRP